MDKDLCYVRYWQVGYLDPVYLHRLLIPERPKGCQARHRMLPAACMATAHPRNRETEKIEAGLVWECQTLCS